MSGLTVPYVTVAGRACIGFPGVTFFRASKRMSLFRLSHRFVCRPDSRSIVFPNFEAKVALPNYASVCLPTGFQGSLACRFSGLRAGLYADRLLMRRSVPDHSFPHRVTFGPGPQPDLGVQRPVPRHSGFSVDKTDAYVLPARHALLPCPAVPVPTPLFASLGCCKYAAPIACRACSDSSICVPLWPRCTPWREAPSSDALWE